MERLQAAHCALVPAGAEETAVCLALLEQARAFQRQQGFFQWPDDYPDWSDVAEDIRLNRGYLLLVRGEAAGYLCLDFMGEPAYRTLQGRWNTGEDYAVVHRMGFGEAYRGLGLGKIAFALVEQACRARGVQALRIDTDAANLRMQHVLLRSGFQYCGLVHYPDKDRLGYDKSLEENAPAHNG